ncbi:TonB-dependent receptor domain-containing protein [Billgrantia montanilacus]|uniref:TonB-dependent receptor n=1 Tax=Billgrantia montanilacus TaxID=2282305 RepID=A0A368TPZ8_9GAMM|nr:TonB-dependent receptor [Halomonas montanilacus]RCV86396.1 TonB-dependent receptor [Halomonas montanilacus]
MKHTLSIATLAFLMLPPLSAQGTESSSAEAALDALTVTGTRVPTDLSRAPMIVDVIDRNDPTLSTASRVEDVLSQQPGLHVAGQGRRSGQTLSLRGFGRNGVLVRLDGVRQDISTGHIGNFFVDPALLREVQVARGALSSLYGSNAMGGVVSFDTVDAADLLRPGESRGARFSIGGATASDELGVTLSLFGRRDTSRGEVDGLVAIGRSESGDIRRAGGDEAPDDARLHSLLAKGGWEPVPTQRLFVSWQHYDEDATQPANPQQLGFDASNPLRDRSVTSDNLQLGHRWQPTAATDMTSRLTLSRQAIDEPAANRTLERLGAQSDGYHVFDHGWLSQTLAFGVEVEQARQVPDGMANGFPRADIDTQAFYLDNTLTVGHFVADGGSGEFDLGLGARYDRYDAEGRESRSSTEDRVSPRVRLAWRPTERLMLYSGYAEAFRAPGLSELYASERHFAGFCPSPFFCFPDNFWVPNPDLQPETSRTHESGFSWRAGDWGLRAAYFDTRADDFIDTAVDIIAGTTQATNVNRAQLWGFDARLEWQPSTLPSLRAFAGLAEVSGKDRDNDAPLGQLTPLEGTLGADLAITGHDVVLGWRARFAESFDKRDSDDALPGYGLHDLQLAWQITPSLDTSMRLRNVADKVWYRPDGSLGDGRSLFATLNLQW